MEYRVSNPGQLFARQLYLLHVLSSAVPTFFKEVK